MTERAKIIKIVTVSAILFAFLLFISMIINFISLAKANSRKAELNQELKRLEAIIEANEEEISYKSTDDYIDRYAREYLNMQGSGEQAFVAKK